jgi:uncharacterized phosphosugar-binding protein
MLGSLMLSEFREAHIRTGKRLLAPASVILLSSRPEGPAMDVLFRNSVGIKTAYESTLSSGFILTTILTGLDEVLYKLFVVEQSTRELAKELGTPTLFP